jgi:hypothetical protein
MMLTILFFFLLARKLRKQHAIAQLYTHMYDTKHNKTAIQQKKKELRNNDRYDDTVKGSDTK